MKVYISVDIEGITGVTHWDETELGKPDYHNAVEQMHAETIAACEGALQAGADEIWVKDAHDSARNLNPARLPRAARLLRGWSGHPFLMQQELDNTFGCLALIGYHSPAGSQGSPLAHSMSLNLSHLRINGCDASEFTIAAYTAAYVNVPLVLVSGDQGLIESINAFHPQIATVAVKQGVGNSTVNLHPAEAIERIQVSMAGAVAKAAQDPGFCRMPLPESFVVEPVYRNAFQAYRASFYPGARRSDDLTVQFTHADFFEVLRFMLFTL